MRPLSRVEGGIIQRNDRFGYIQLPRSLRLKYAIHIHDPRGAPSVEIAVAITWDLKTGKMQPLGVAPWDD